MAHALVHTAVVEDLLAQPRSLSPELVEALSSYLVYARFGAVLPDLPWYALDAPGLARGLGLHRQHEGRPPLVTLFHNAAPVGLGLRLAELVAASSLVGRLPGLAVVAGYFTHLAVDRTLCPPVAELATSLADTGEPHLAAERRIEWFQATQLMLRRHGQVVGGWPGVREHLRVLRRPGFPFRGLSRGLHLLVTTACRDVLGPAPDSRALDRWVQGLYAWTRLLASPLGARLMPSRDEAAGLLSKAYRDGFDFERSYAAAVDRARHHVLLAYDYVAGRRFDRMAREVFFDAVPEGSLL